MDHLCHVLYRYITWQQCGKRKTKWQFRKIENITHELPCFIAFETDHLYIGNNITGGYYFFNLCMVVSVPRAGCSEHSQRCFWAFIGNTDLWLVCGKLCYLYWRICRNTRAGQWIWCCISRNSCGSWWYYDPFFC